MNGDTSSTPAPQPPIFVVDPDAGQRSFIGRVLGRGGFRIEALATGQAALAAAERERPYVVVLDVRLGDITGYEVCRALKEWFGDAIAILFTSRDRTEPCDRVAGLLLGGDDYMEKPLAGDELLVRVRGLVRHIRAKHEVVEDRFDLTGRELEVVWQMCDGLNQKAIAERLYISPKTVAKHIEHINQKLGARSRAEAVAIAYQRGLHRRPGEPLR